MLKEILEGTASYTFEVDSNNNMVKNTSKTIKEVNDKFGYNSILDVTVNNTVTIKFDNMGNKQKDEIKKYLGIK